MSGLTTNLVKFAPNWTNRGLFKGAVKLVEGGLGKLTVKILKINIF